MAAASSVHLKNVARLWRVLSFTTGIVEVGCAVLAVCTTAFLLVQWLLLINYCLGGWLNDAAEVSQPLLMLCVEETVVGSWSPLLGCVWHVLEDLLGCSS